MERSPDAVQRDPEPRALALGDFGAASQQQRLDVPPRNCSWHRVREDGSRVLRCFAFI